MRIDRTSVASGRLQGAGERQKGTRHPHRCGKYQSEKQANGRTSRIKSWEALRIHNAEESEQGDILHMGQNEEEWEEVKIKVDSGAVDTVGPRSLGKGFPLLETEASKQGKFYRAANETKIGIDVQIAEVKKTLGSVRRICEAGNRVVFDEDGSYVENKSNG